MSNNIQLIEIPKWGLSMEEGTVNQWLIEEGDSFQVGDELVEIESSKIVNVVEAHFSGILRRILANAGETLSVAEPIAVSADISVSDSEIDTFIASLGKRSGALLTTGRETASEPKQRHISTTTPQAQPSSLNTPAAINDGVSVPDVLKQGEDDSGLHATIHARKLAKEWGINLHKVATDSRNNRISRKDVEATVIAAGGTITQAVVTRLPKRSGSTKEDSQIAATPVARRLAKQLGINLNDCRASGSHGRVSKADVELAAGNRPMVTNETGKILTQPANLPDNESTELTLDGMRRTIASRLQESKQNAPHFRLSIDANIDRLLAIRKKLNSTEPAAKVSVNDFLIKASATALMQVPECNIQFDGNTITRFKNADISVAVALQNGLITPILRAANTKGLVEISNEVRELVTKAKAGSLSPDEFQGGTFSISNLGMFDIKQFDAIINSPQASILAVGSGEQQMIVKAGEPSIATIVTLTLSSDHRVIDGALGCRFLEKLKWFVENPAMMVA